MVPLIINCLLVDISQALSLN